MKVTDLLLTLCVLLPAGSAFVAPTTRALSFAPNVAKNIGILSMSSVGTNQRNFVQTKYANNQSNQIDNFDRNTIGDYDPANEMVLREEIRKEEQLQLQRQQQQRRTMPSNLEVLEKRIADYECATLEKRIEELEQGLKSDRREDGGYGSQYGTDYRPRGRGNLASYYGNGFYGGYGGYGYGGYGGLNNWYYRASGPGSYQDSWRGYRYDYENGIRGYYYDRNPGYYGGNYGGYGYGGYRGYGGYGYGGYGGYGRGYYGGVYGYGYPYGGFHW